MSIDKPWFRRVPLAATERVNPFRSLPARISMLVFGATLMTSLFVAGISVQEMDQFLRGKIETKFPEIAEQANVNLNAWYDQQIMNLRVLATSEVVTRNVASLKAETDARRAGSGGDVSEYLAYVLDRFDNFDALFLLRPDGERLLWVGEPFELSPAAIERLIASRDAPAPILTDNGETYVQIISLGVQGRGDRDLGLLSAVMPLSAVAEPLRVQQLGETGEILLLDDAGVYVAVGKQGSQIGTLDRPPQSAVQPGRVLDYANATGERVVGYAVPLSQYGLTLAVEERYSEAFAPVLTAFRRVVSINIAVVLLLCFAAFKVAASIARPIEALSEAARRISADDQDVELPANETRDEVGVLTRSFKEMWSRLTSKAMALERSQEQTEKAVQQMREQNAELQRMNEVLEQLSITDGLTKLHNHRFFQEQLRKEIKRADRMGDALALVLIDIDHFKAWNDEFGHAGGDEILRKIATVMNGLVRETDILARYGGEEFALVLPKTDWSGAINLAEKIRATVAETPMFDDLPKSHDPLTVSIGVNVYAGDPKALFEGADRALYRAKDEGRDCVMPAQEVE